MVLKKHKNKIINNKDNQELLELIESNKTQIKVVGCGGAGNNTITRLNEVGIEGVETIVVNTDAQDLLHSNADRKVLIGKELTLGLGAGANPLIGMESAKESKEELKTVLQGSDLVFLTCGLGGGTGTGSAPIVATEAKKIGALTIGIVTLPFTMEGRGRIKNAKIGFDNLQSVVDCLIIIPNDRLLEVVPDVSIESAFKIADEILVDSVKGIIELVTKPGLVNLDFADLRTVIKSSGISMIGIGESSTENRASEAVKKALNNPLLSVDIKNSTGALVNVMGGENISIREAQNIVQTISNNLDKDAKIIWGASIDKSLGKSIRVMIVITGVQYSKIFPDDKNPQTSEKHDMEKLLGVEFVD